MTLLVLVCDHAGMLLSVSLSEYEHVHETDPLTTVYIYITYMYISVSIGPCELLVHLLDTCSWG